MENLSRLLLRHRRPLAALFAALAVLLGLAQIHSEPPGRDVVVAAHDLASGTVLTADDVEFARLSHSVAPAHSAQQVDDVVGRAVAGPMRRGEVVTDRRVIRADRMSGFPDGAVLATVRLADADALSNLRVGDSVDVVAVDPDSESHADVVAHGAEIVTLPPSFDDSGGVPVGVATTEKEALELAERALDSRLSVLAARP